MPGIFVERKERAVRVVYRGDLDGTVSAAMLIEIGLGDVIIQAHPKDMQDGKVEVTDQDILCNLPYHPNCNMWFDHHSSEMSADDFPQDFTGLVEEAPSAAGLVYRYFRPDYPILEKYKKVVEDTDIFDSAQLNLQQVRQAEGTILLGFLLDGFPVYGQKDMDGAIPSDLDEANGHTGVTADYPDGIYHYHIVLQEPYISGGFRGTPGTVTQ